MVKRFLERQDEEGWSSRSGTVCSRCFTDYAIQDFIKANATQKKCSYCEREADEPIASEIDEVMSFISRGIWREFDIPENCLPYDSSEGGWQLATPMDSYDLFDRLNICSADSGELNDDLAQSFCNSSYVQRDPLVLSQIDGLKYSWSSFCQHTKHETRFVFFQVPVEKPPEDHAWHPDDEWGGKYSPPYQILLDLGKMVETHKLVRTVQKGTVIVRARQHEAGLSYVTAKDLGSPPESKARQSRMSPAGIPMFYGASDEATAFIEIFEAASLHRGVATFARFATARDLLLLDLTELPRVPSLFDEEHYDERPAVLFLHHLQGEISASITRDGREHYEYVPTQIVAEYFRRVFRHGIRPLDGLIFKSSNENANLCYCIFATAEHCADDGAAESERGLLRLKGHRVAAIDFASGSFAGAITGATFLPGL